MLDDFTGYDASPISAGRQFEQLSNGLSSPTHAVNRLSILRMVVKGVLARGQELVMSDVDANHFIEVLYIKSKFPSNVHLTGFKRHCPTR